MPINPNARRRMLIPSGMLAPAGLSETPVDPAVQSTVRPPGSLLSPSPGYDSVRVGKNRFQGKGPTGGFKPLEFAEDIGGTGAALSVIPGDTGEIESTEWLPDESQYSKAVVIADRKHEPGWAKWLHDGMGTMPDMGDRQASRPLSKAWFARLNPTRVLKEEYQTSPELAVAMGAGLVYVVYLLAQEVERQLGSSRPKGVGSAVTDVPAAGARATGDVAGDAVDKIGEATDNAVKAIEDTTAKAVDQISEAADKVTGD